MCKYCEAIKCKNNRYIEYASKDQCNIVDFFNIDEFRIRYSYKDGEGYDCMVSVPITHCPWCGRKLGLLDNEPELSPEDEIARLEERINYTNILLKRLVETVWLWVDQSEYNPRATPEVIGTLLDIEGKI